MAAAVRTNDPIRAELQARPALGLWRRLGHWSHGIDRLLVGGCALVIAVSALQLLLFSPGRDQSIYAVVARGVLDGQMPYRDLWDFKPPGIFVLYALAFKVFGFHLWAPRLLEVLSLLITCGLLVRLGQAFFVSVRPGLLAAALAAWLHTQLEFWHSGQPESFAGMFNVLALWWTLRAAKEPGRVALTLGIGLAAGAAFLLKPPLGGVALVSAVYLVRAAQLNGQKGLQVLRAPLAIAFGALALLGLCGLWFWSQGAWPALAWTLFEYTPGYTRLGWEGNGALAAFYHAAVLASTRFSALLAVGLVATWASAITSSREREGVSLVMGVVFVHLAGIALQAKFFAYHFGATFPLLALIAGLGWSKIWRRLEMLGPHGGAVAAALIVLVASARQAVTDVPLGFWGRLQARAQYLIGQAPFTTRAALDAELDRAADFNLGANRQVAERVHELMPSGGHLFVWGFEPAIYWFSEQRPASRFIYNVAQRSPWAREQARTELLLELRENSPAVVVVQHHDYFSFVTGDNLDSAAALGTFPELAEFLQRDYAQQGSVEDFDLYLRSDVPVSPGE